MTARDRADAALAHPSWWIYSGNGRPGQAVLPAPPPWREFEAAAAVTENGAEPVAPEERGDVIRRLGRFAAAVTHTRSDRELDLINAAIYLRRPMLITGKAGTGKSSLARSIAHELGLGKVLHWPITSRSTLDYGLYRYDAIGRLQEVNLLQASRHRTGEDEPERRLSTDGGNQLPPDIGRYLRLGPLGSAMLARTRPRVLLIDEIDKSDVDLPNDLLTVFEDGYFEIPELTRLRSPDAVYVMDADSDVRVGILQGVVRCLEFPIIVMTSNGERDFPPAFLRRCIRIRMEIPDEQRIAEMVEAHLGPEGLERGRAVMADFVQRIVRGEDLAADQLMNALYMTTTGARGPDGDIARLIEDLTRPLDESDR